MAGATGLGVSDVIVTISSNWGDVDMPLDKWMASGPGWARPLVQPVAARSKSTGETLPQSVVPLAYRNNKESLRAILLGNVRDPWGRAFRALAAQLSASVALIPVETHVAGAFAPRPLLYLQLCVKQHSTNRISFWLGEALEFYSDLALTVKILAPFALNDAQQGLVRWQVVSADPPDWEEIQQLLDQEAAIWASGGALDRARQIAARALREGLRFQWDEATEAELLDRYDVTVMEAEQAFFNGPSVRRAGNSHLLMGRIPQGRTLLVLFDWKPGHRIRVYGARNLTDGEKGHLLRRSVDNV